MVSCPRGRTATPRGDSVTSSPPYTLFSGCIPYWAIRIPCPGPYAVQGATCLVGFSVPSGVLYLSWGTMPVKAMCIPPWASTSSMISRMLRTPVRGVKAGISPLGYWQKVNQSPTQTKPYNTLPPFEQRDSWSLYGDERAYSCLLYTSPSPRD